MVGIVAGMFSNIFIYPHFSAMYGFYQGVLNLVKLLIVLPQMGVNAIVVRFHHRFGTSEEGYPGLLRYSSSYLALGLLIFCPAFYFLSDLFLPRLSLWFKHIDTLLQFKLEITVLLGLLSGLYLLKSISQAHYRIVVPSILLDLISLKIVVPIAIFVIGSSSYPNAFRVFIYVLLGILTLTFLALLVYMARNSWLNSSAAKVALNKRDKSEMRNFGMFGMLNQLGGELAFRIDFTLVFMLLGAAPNGLYAIFSYLTSVISTPLNSIKNISAPLIAEYWKDHDYDKIKALYRESSVGLFAFGGLIFLLIWISFNDILAIINKSDVLAAKYVFLILAVGIFSNLITGLNGTILVQSKYYRWNLIFNLTLGVINVFMTYYLIQYVFENPYKLVGAALGTAIALVTFNILKSGFLFLKFRFNPFSVRMAYLIGIGIVVYGLSLLIPSSSYSFLNIGYKSLFVLLAYGLTVYRLNISPQLNEQADRYLAKMRK